MSKRKKQNSDDSPLSSPEQDSTIRLRFKGKILELIPVPGYPIHVIQTEAFEDWIDGVVDVKTNTRINNRIDKVQRGLLGDWKDVGEGVFELRLNFGPGYRLYYAKYEQVIVILLVGGDKSSQQKDISDAKQVWKGLKDEITQV